jgi:sorbitol/mannitol transport system permease protein
MTLTIRRLRSETRLIERVSPLRAIVAWIVGLLTFFPVLYIVVTGFKTEANAVALPPTLVPVPAGINLPGTFTPTLENYQEVMSRSFWPFFQNSIVVVLLSTVLVLALALPCAYGLTWRAHTNSRGVLFFFLSTKFLPAVGIIVALFYIAKVIGETPGFPKMLDNPALMIVMYTAMNLPIAVWMLRSFFDEVPRDVLDASRVDGASTRQELVSVALPMVVPGLVATVFVCVIFAWNEFFLAVSLMAHNGATVTMYMIGFVASEGLFWAKLSAAGTMAILPIVLIGWAAQRQLVRGLSLGAVK